MKENSPSIYINGKFFNKRITGVQRYAHEVYKRIDCKIITCKFSGILGSLWEQLFVPFFHKENLLFSPCNIGPLLRRHHVVTIHDVSFLDNPEWFSRKYRLFYRSIMPILAKKCSHIITDSEFSKQRIIKHFSVHKDKVSVVYCGISDIFSTIETSELNRMKNRFDLGNSKLVLSVGSVDPRKNVTTLVKAWLALPLEVRSGWKLILAGGKNKSFSGVDDIPDVDDVKHLGYVSDEKLSNLYALADIFAYPSLYEGFGLPPLEAMACNTAVLTSNITSLPEVVGDAALLVDPHKQESIKEGLLELMQSESLRDDLAARGLIQSKKFSWDKCAKEVNDILRRFE